VNLTDGLGIGKERWTDLRRLIHELIHGLIHA
jgi:hypothetical protein